MGQKVELRPEQRRNQQIRDQEQQQSRAKAKQPAQIKSNQVNLSCRVNFLEKKPGNQEAAEHEEKIDAKISRIESRNVAVSCGYQDHRNRSQSIQCRMVSRW